MRPNECETIADIKAMTINDVQSSLHIIIGDNGRCMCDLYDDVPLSCSDVLRIMKEEDNRRAWEAR